MSNPSVSIFLELTGYFPEAQFAEIQECIKRNLGDLAHVQIIYCFTSSPRSSDAITILFGHSSGLRTLSVFRGQTQMSAVQFPYMERELDEAFQFVSRSITRSLEIIRSNRDEVIEKAD